MRRLIHIFFICAVAAALSLTGCSDSEPTANSESTTPTGSPAWGGSGESTWGQSEPGGEPGGGSLPGGGFGGD